MSHTTSTILSTFIAHLTESFKNRLQTKTGWGKNEVMEKFTEAKMHALLETFTEVTQEPQAKTELKNEEYMSLGSIDFEQLRKFREHLDKLYPAPAKIEPAPPKTEQDYMSRNRYIANGFWGRKPDYPESKPKGEQDADN